MNTDQIAAEAAEKEIQGFLTTPKGAYFAGRFVKAAIEKARDQWDYEETIGIGEQRRANRAARASEAIAGTSKRYCSDKLASRVQSADTKRLEEWTLYTWDESWAKSHEGRGQYDVWGIKCGRKVIVDHLSKKVCKKLIEAHHCAIDAAMRKDECQP